MKKGFTMIEIMAVFTIAAIILIITVPQMISLLKKSNEEQMESFKENVNIACEAYIEGYLKPLSLKEETTTEVINAKQKIQELKAGNEIRISLLEMMKQDYLSSTLVYPKTNEKLATMQEDKLKNLYVKVSIDKNENYYHLNFSE